MNIAKTGLQHRLIFCALS